MFQINKKTYNFLNKEPPPPLKKIYLCRKLFGQFGVNKRVLYVGLWYLDLIWYYVYATLFTLSNTTSKSRFSLLTASQLSKIFSFLWIIHAIFWLASSHFRKEIKYYQYYISIHVNTGIFLWYNLCFILLNAKYFRFLINGLIIINA